MHQICGVFDATAQIPKIERAAAKFLSAEEEANLRKAELSTLLKKSEDAPVDVADYISEDVFAEEAVAQPSTMPTPATPIRCSVRGGVDEVAVTSSCTTFTPGRRGSVLASANKDMISCLNKMFSGGGAVPPPAAGARTPSARMSMIGCKSQSSNAIGASTPGAVTGVSRRTTLACGAVGTEDDQTPFSIETVAKRTQSKLLKVG